jgi:hypothetical protein
MFYDYKPAPLRAVSQRKATSQKAGNPSRTSPNFRSRLSRSAWASLLRPFGRAFRDAYGFREAGRAAAESYFFIGMAIMSACIFIMSMHFMSFIIISWDMPWHFAMMAMSASDMFIFFIMSMHFMSFIIMSWDISMQLCICILSASVIIIGLFIGIVWVGFVWAQPATVLANMATATAVILRVFMENLRIEAGDPREAWNRIRPQTGRGVKVWDQGLFRAEPAARPVGAASRPKIH